MAMNNAESIIFIINDQFYTFSNKDASLNLSGPLSEFKNSANENTIAYIDASHFNIIPEFLFKETKIDSFLSLTTEKIDSITPVTNKIPQLNSVLLWTLEETIKKKLILKNPGITFHHFSELFLNEPIDQNLHPEIKLRLSENIIYILCYKKGKLQIANRFNISGPEDITYYTLLCAEHCHLNKENTLLNIKGIYKEKLIEQLNKYFNTKNIHTTTDQSIKSFI